MAGRRRGARDAAGCRRRQVLEEILEVLERVQAVGLGSLDDAVDGGAGLGSFRGVAEQPILAGEAMDLAMTGCGMTGFSMEKCASHPAERRVSVSEARMTWPL